MTEQPPKPRRGCLFYGGITCVALLVLAIGLLLLGVHYVKGLVNRYTDTQPIELPTVKMAPAEREQLKQRFEAFEAAVRERQPTPLLSLSADEINALLASGPAQDNLSGKFYISLDGDQLKGQVSLPLDQAGLKGRYLNGSATFNVTLQNGLLVVAPQTLVVKGKPVPEMYMAKFRRENLAAGLTNEPKAVAVLQGLEDVQIKDGSLVIVPKEKK